MRVLVTGGSGFIGSAVVKKLVDAGHTVLVLDNFTRGSDRRLAGIACTVTFGDVCDLESVLNAVRGCDAVFHLAAVNGTENFYKHPETVLNVAVKGMLNVLEACRDFKVKDLFFTSSSEVYHQAAVVPTPENVPLVVPDVTNPRYSYSGGKILSELYMNLVAPGFLKRAIVVRPHNVYGPDMGWEHVIPQLTMKAIQARKNGSREITLKGSGEQTRAFLHVYDFADAMMTLLEKGQTGTYNVGVDFDVNIGSLAGWIAEAVGISRPIIVAGPPVAGEPKDRCPDTQKIRALGWSRKIGLVSPGLQDTVRWYVEHQKENPHV